MQSAAATVAEYVKSLPADRRDAIECIRAIIRKNIDPVFQEGMQYGMIGYYVPHAVYPAGYHCDPKQPLPYAALASQKNYMAIYLPVYMDPAMLTWFHKAWAKSGKKLDMGKCCVRFKNVDDVPLEVIAESLRKMPAKKYIAIYESARQAQAKSKVKKKPAKSIKKTAPAKKKK